MARAAAFPLARAAGKIHRAGAAAQRRREILRNRNARRQAGRRHADIRNIDWKSRKAEFFITIGEKQFWDKGFGTDALRIVIRLAFDKMNLNRLWLTVLVDNPRAIRCYEKCGFVREGLLRQESFVDGKYRDVHPDGVAARGLRSNSRCMTMASKAFERLQKVGDRQTLR